MPVVENGIIRNLSVSQAERFDRSQLGGCETRWWFENVQGLRQPDSDATDDGNAGHALLAHWLATGEPPQGRVRMGKAVTAVIAKGELQPVPGQQIETRFDGQPQRDAGGKWIPVDREKTLWLGGLPWDGFIDQRWFDGVVHVRDHKFSADIVAKEADYPSLIQTIQMPLYALDSLRQWPDASQFELIHHYVSRKGTESKMRRELVTLPQVQRRAYEIGQLTVRMTEAAKATRPEDVPFNRKACSAGYGCPHQSICPAFKERKVEFTAAEIDLFNSPAKPTPAFNPDGHVTSRRIPESDLGVMPAPVAATPDVIPVSIIPPDAPPNDPNAPTPDQEKAAKAAAKKTEKAAAKEPLIWPDCADCGTALNPDNAAKRRGGGFKHINCGKFPQKETEQAIANAIAPLADIVESSKPRPSQATAIAPTPEPDRATTAPPIAPEAIDANELGQKLAKRLIEKLQVQRVIIELGPETLAVLRALIK